MKRCHASSHWSDHIASGNASLRRIANNVSNRARTVIISNKNIQYNPVKSDSQGTEKNGPT